MSKSIEKVITDLKSWAEQLGSKDFNTIISPQSFDVLPIPPESQKLKKMPVSPRTNEIKKHEEGH